MLLGYITVYFVPFCKVFEIILYLNKKQSVFEKILYLDKKQSVISKTHYELHVWIYYISKLLNASKFTNMINLEQHYFASQQLDINKT